MILNAKCHAIRDAQILERGLICKELGQEDKRLDQMMEVERQKAIKMQEEIEEMRNREKIRYGGSLYPSHSHRGGGGTYPPDTSRAAFKVLIL